MIDPNISDPSGQLTRKLLRQFAGIWLVFFGGMAVAQGWLRHHTVPAVVFGLLALTFGPLGLVRPQAIRPLFQLSIAVTRPIGWVVSHLILGCLFYGIFTPVGLLFRLMGRDVLRRKCRTDLNTYWLPKPSATDFVSYLRQS